MRALIEEAKKQGFKLEAEIEELKFDDKSDDEEENVVELEEKK